VCGCLIGARRRGAWKSDLVDGGGGGVLLGYANTAAETMVGGAAGPLAALNDEAVGELRLGGFDDGGRRYVSAEDSGGHFLRQYPQGEAFVGERQYGGRWWRPWQRKRWSWESLKGRRCGGDVKTVAHGFGDEMVLIVSPNHAWAARKGGAICRCGCWRECRCCCGERGSGSRRGWWRRAVEEDRVCRCDR